MLRITIPAIEGWDEEKEEFVSLSEDVTLEMEHSLVSLSKWEAKYNKIFLDDTYKKTFEETMDYIRFMTVNEVDPEVYKYLTNEHIKKIEDYISAPMTATKIYDATKTPGGNKEKVSSELIYYWMIAANIPFECERWHLNRLITLIRICEIKNRPPKKMSKREIMRQNAKLNAERRRKYNTKG